MWRLTLMLAAALALAGCAGSKALFVDTVPVERPRFDPPMPFPVQPALEIEVKVLTHGVTTVMNEGVEAGAALPYAFFALSEQDWLTLGQWQQDTIRWMAQARAVIEFYRGPGPDPPLDE